MARWLTTAALVALTTGTAAAGEATKAARDHVEGEYAGVSPGVRPLAVREGKVKPRPAAKATLLWIGFGANAGGGADVWFQTATPLEADQRVDGQTLVVFLPGLTRQVANTRRAIETAYFDNPIARITTRKVKAQRKRKGVKATPAGVEVRIQFKNPRDAAPGSLKVATEADGLNYTYLSFPKGTPVEGDPAS